MTIYILIVPGEQDVLITKRNISNFTCTCIWYNNFQNVCLYVWRCWYALQLSTSQVNIVQGLPLLIRMGITSIHRFSESIDSPFLMIMKAIININKHYIPAYLLPTNNKNTLLMIGQNV